jgi:hypothetical protein
MEKHGSGRAVRGSAGDFISQSASSFEFFRTLLNSFIKPIEKRWELLSGTLSC